MRGPGGPAAPDDVAVPAQDRVRGDQQPQSRAPRCGYHAERRREQGPVRPGQVRAARLPPLQDGELVAQDQISAVCHVSSRRDSRSHAASRVIKRNTNRRHMTGDHHGRVAGTATLLLTATDEILGTHSYTDVGSDFYDTRINPERRKRNHIRQLEALGYQVTLEPAA